jgi:predicted nucleic-acid-binding Zn-ribbon protein
MNNELKCPHCGAEELHPTKYMLLIRGYKVKHSGYWWSQCLVCAGFYDEDLNYTEEAGDRNKGWF